MSAGVKHPALLPAPLYQGCANAWECDEGGHLNVRFQVERAQVGLMHFARHLSMGTAFRADATATLALTDLHVRFHKEALPGAPLSMHGAVAAFGDDDAALCCDMRHIDGAPATTMVLKVAHAEPRMLKRYPWSSRTRAAAKALTRALPAHAKPRSIDVDTAPRAITLAHAQEVGATRIGGAAVLPDQCDAFGRLRFEHFFGRASDSAPNLFAEWRRAIADETGAQTAGAMLEARLAIRKYPRAGDLIEVHSGMVEIGEKTVRIAHWFIDPVGGACWASMEAMTLTFDPTKRKALNFSPALRAAWAERLAPMGA